MSIKGKVPFEVAYPLARDIERLLLPTCDTIKIVGSLRREKTFVGDIEFLVIPKQEYLIPSGELFPITTNLFEIKIKELLLSRYLSLRHKKDGTSSNGSSVKLLLHTDTGIALDFFITTPECWFSMLVCRTGSTATNSQIAGLAKRKGWRWKMSGSGFLCIDRESPLYGETLDVHSEEDVFKFVNLPYKEPKDR